MTEEMVYHVDENDNVIGKITRKEMRDKNLLHRGIFALIFNSKGEIFVHKRTKNKIIYPSYYDILISGGVKYGENYDEAVKREIKEEIGGDNIKLNFLFNERFHNEVDNTFSNVYKTIYDGPIKLQKEEVESGEFVSLQKLKKMIEEKRFTPAGIEIFNKYLEGYHGK